MIDNAIGWGNRGNLIGAREETREDAGPPKVRVYLAKLKFGVIGQQFPDDRVVIVIGYVQVAAVDLIFRPVHVLQQVSHDLDVCPPDADFKNCLLVPFTNHRLHLRIRTLSYQEIHHAQVSMFRSHVQW